MSNIYIYGASGHGLVVSEIALACGYSAVIFIDDGENEYLSFEEVKENVNIPLAFGIGSNKVRRTLFDKVLKHDFKVVSLFHPSSVISSSAIIDIGTVIMPNVVVNAYSKIGKGVILNTSCIVEHENIIEDFVHISPNAALSGKVRVGENSHIGIGSCIIQGLKIGSGCVIGAGSVVVENMQNNKLCFGNPCKVIKDVK